MKKSLFVMIALFLLIGTSNVFALDLGTNITIWDGVGVAYEDNEVEPNCELGQKWDLEGMFLKGTMLSLVGGYDFVQGEVGNNQLFLPGDIFIDVNGDARYGGDAAGQGGGNQIVQQTYRYDYVLDLHIGPNDYLTGTYDIIKLHPDFSLTETVYYNQNDAANPFKYAGVQPNNDGYVEESVGSGIWNYLAGSQDGPDYGFEGWLGNNIHNVFDVDLSYFAGQDLLVHYTYGCGNDNLMGEATVPVPEPATMVMIGLSTIGLAAFRRKK
jgi:hypothetical protein